MNTLVEIAKEAIQNCFDNDGILPSTPEEAAAEMVEQGIFGNDDETLDSNGDILPSIIEAVKQAKAW